MQGRVVFVVAEAARFGVAVQQDFASQRKHPLRGNGANREKHVMVGHESELSPWQWIDGFCIRLLLVSSRAEVEPFGPVIDVNRPEACTLPSLCSVRNTRRIPWPIFGLIPHKSDRCATQND